MAEIDRRRRQKSDDDSEKSFSESDIEAEDLNETPTSPKDTPEKFNRRRRRVKYSDEQSFSDSDSEQEDYARLIKCKREIIPAKTGDGSEYESAEEEEKVVDKSYQEESLKEQESLSELVDEEGGEEGIAEPEDIEGEFLNGDGQEDNVSEDGEYVEEERQQGDGEECSPSNAAAEKELDFDEDRRNPQYIPKKGMFYEHDDRNNEDIKEKQEEPSRDRKKKLWLDEGKWGHDRFREEEQYPKSRNELIETYGYDIRNEDGPPRARRRRRYGRGPTKYERNWEDVTAYGRERFKTSPRGSPRGGRRGNGRFRGGNPRFRGRGHRDFNSENSIRNDESVDEINNEVPGKNDHEDSETKEGPPVIRREEFPALPTKENEPEVEEPPQHAYYSKSPPKTVDSKSVRTLTFENSSFSGRSSAERDIPPRRGKTPPFASNHDRGSRRPNTRGGRGPGRGDYRGRGRGNNQRHISPRFLENKINNNLSAEMEQLSLEVNENCDVEHVPQVESNGDLPHNTNVINEMQNMALKGAGDSSSRPKRYSSIRQRSLPETNTYQNPPPQQQVQPQHPTYFETAGYQPALYAPTETCVPTPSTQSQTATSTPIMNPPAAYQTFTPPPYSDNYGLRMSVTPPPRLFPQVSVQTPQPILAAPPCITPAPTLMNFAPPPPPTGYPFTFQQFTTPPPAPPPPNEIFPSGITYYYQATQPPPIRPTVQKRAKAIPIVPPPEKETIRKEKNESSISSNNNSRKFSDNSNEAEDVDLSSVRTESSPQLQTTVGVES